VFGDAFVKATRVHLVEQGGRGGVFQHAVALARLLAANGLEFVFHTATDAELDASADGVRVCACVDRLRHRPPRWRRPALGARYLGRTLPHLVRDTRGEVVHVQGTWTPAFAALTLAALRPAAGRLAFSPHNTFARSGLRSHEWLLRRSLALADAVIVFSAADSEGLASIRTPVHVSPLIQLLPDGAAEPSWPWRTVWDADRTPVILFAGQLRRDKRFDRLVEAVRVMSNAPLLAVVGEDRGAAAEWKRLARRAGVQTHWSVGFQPLERFVAAVAAADVVVCPYERASQSGVLAVASAVGTPTVATAVGGLAEAAARAVPADDPRALATAIEQALTDERPSVHPAARSLDAARVAHRVAYGLDRGSD
jgi:glycosyltransferase involved in cell wall biosynthesis